MFSHSLTSYEKHNICPWFSASETNSNWCKVKWWIGTCHQTSNQLLCFESMTYTFFWKTGKCYSISTSCTLYFDFFFLLVCKGSCSTLNLTILMAGSPVCIDMSEKIFVSSVFSWSSSPWSWLVTPLAGLTIRCWAGQSMVITQSERAFLEFNLKTLIELIDGNRPELREHFPALTDTKMVIWR